MIGYEEKRESGGTMARGRGKAGRVLSAIALVGMGLFVACSGDGPTAPSSSPPNIALATPAPEEIPPATPTPRQCHPYKGCR